MTETLSIILLLLAIVIEIATAIALIDLELRDIDRRKSARSDHTTPRVHHDGQ